MSKAKKVVFFTLAVWGVFLGLRLVTNKLTFLPAFLKV